MPEGSGGQAKRDRGGASRSPQRSSVQSGKEPIATIAQTERQRIAKLMARVGLCSRRDAEAWIVDGRVTLNGTILTSPATDVGPGDTILVDGIPIPAAEKTRLFLFHKPRGLVTSDHDPEGRETIVNHLAANWPDGPRVVTIGRLDINTEGLLLLTNDGGLARILELPSTGWVRRYRVRAKGETDQGVLDRLRDGLVVDGIDYAGIEAKLDRIQGANCWLTMGLREGKNREIKRVLEHLGLEVNRLIRLSYGPFQLLDLAEGAVEEVKTRILRDQLGATLAAEAGVDFADSDAPIVPPPVAARDQGATNSRRNDPVRLERRVDTKRGERDRKTKLDARLSKSNGEGETTPSRERPVTGTRRHVSTLRAEVASDQREGPRKRIERTEAIDRKDRTVKVERLVSTRPLEIEPRARRGPGRFAPRDGDTVRRDGAQRRASPSALAKRERIAKSGGERDAGERPRSRAPLDRPREDRDKRRNDLGRAKVRIVGPEEPRERSSRERPGTRQGGADRTSETRAGRDKPWKREPTSGDRPTSVRRGGEETLQSAVALRGAKRTKDRATSPQSASAALREKSAREIRLPRADAKNERPASARTDRPAPRRDGNKNRDRSGVKTSPPLGSSSGKPAKPRSPKR